MAYHMGLKKRAKAVVLLFLCLSWISFGFAVPPVVLFSPKDHPAKTLVSMINAAQNKVHAAVYMITDKYIADALINAKKRGVDVQVVTDKTSVDSSYGKGAYLRGNGVQVFEYHPQGAKGFAGSEALMHNKFAIIDTKTWTGSFNWTKSADQRNQENVIIVDDKDVCDKYDARFCELKTQLCTAVHGDAAQGAASHGKPGAGPKPGPWDKPKIEGDIGAIFWRMLPDFLKSIFGE